ncbi:MAG TPA: type II toxin-antitoxin system VapC family toxin [Gemmatimonadaceae bacterium]|nr:type II toxin-antitoxin system VapC family toxin [Gemmatimonadaceae bacterium]
MTPRRRRARRAAEPHGTGAPSQPRRLLLDTHVWLWWQADDARLGAAARRLIQQAAEVKFSAASAWEISIKAAIGKLRLPRNADIAAELDRDGFQPLPVEIAHAAGVRALPDLHRDPFDRLLISQALAEGLTLVSADPALAHYGVPVVDATD